MHMLLFGYSSTPGLATKQISSSEEVQQLTRYWWLHSNLHLFGIVLLYTSYGCAIVPEIPYDRRSGQHCG